MTNFSLTGSCFSGSYLRVFTILQNKKIFCNENNRAAFLQLKLTK